MWFTLPIIWYVFCFEGTFRVPFDIVGSAAYGALMKFDAYMSRLSPEKRHLGVIRFVNIDKAVTESLIAVFTSLMRGGRVQTTATNGDSGAASSDDSYSSEPRGAKTSSSSQKCCICGKTETRTNKLYHHQLCSHKSCSGCRRKQCNKCLSLTPAIVHSTRNTAEPRSRLGNVSCRVQHSVITQDVVVNDNASLPFRPRSNSFQVPSSRPSSCTTMETTAGAMTEPDSCDSKRENSPEAQNEFASRPQRRRSSSVTRDDRPKGSAAEKCVICMDTMTNPKKLVCGHTFCAECIETAFTHAAKCPCCGHIFGRLKGNQPTGGTMKVRRSGDDVAGYSKHGSFVIDYDIPSGIQQVS